jgi:hypothetical protein
MYIHKISSLGVIYMTVIGSDFNKTSWDYILKKPVEYTPKSHYHYLSDVIDLNEFLAEASTHTHTNKASIDKITEDEGVPLWNGGAWPSSVTSLAWTSITNKPTSFVPTTHTHAIADVNSLQETINSLALKAHTHAELHTHYNLTSIGKITESAGLPLWNGNAWPVSGSVDWANITDKPAAYTPASHSHATTDITGLTNHNHTNKAILDTYNQSNADISDAILLKHTHVNITTLNKVTENAGIPLWNGGAWPTSSVAWTNITGKPENIELTISNSHTHENKTTIDKITEAADLPLWNGSAWPGTSDLSGYMTKAVYDTNNDGIVDAAEVANSVTWANVSNKPTSTITDIDLAVTNTHTHTNKTAIDRITESEDLPLWNGSAWPGTGDMMKSVYDPDNDGKVLSAILADTAGAVAWANVIGIPVSVVSDIDDAVSKRHAHGNHDTLNKIGENGILPTWNGEVWPEVGNMAKSVYDPDDDGKVLLAVAADIAYSAEWSVITNKPTSNIIDIDDAVTKKHLHANSLILDQIDEAFTTTLKNTYDSYSTTLATKQDALGFTAENLAHKGIANGYAGLDASGKVPIIQIPTSIIDLSPALTTATLVPSTYDTFVTLYTNSTGATVELDFASIINTASTSRDVYLRITASDGTTLVHTILPKTTLSTQDGVEVEEGKYVIANGQILQCQTSGDLTEFYVAVRTTETTPHTVTTYTDATWTDVINNTTGNARRIDLVSISNTSTSATISAQLRIVTDANVLVNTILTTTNIEPTKVIKNKSGRWILANTQKLQVQLSAAGCDVMATTKANS